MLSGCLFVRPFVCYKTCQQDILYTNELILMQICTSGPRGRDMKQSTGVRVSLGRLG